MKKWGGFIYLLAILVFTSLMCFGVKGSMFKGIPIWLGIVVYILITRFVLMPFSIDKLTDDNTPLRFVPIYQEYSIFEDGVLQMTFLISLLSTILFLVFYLVVPYSVWYKLFSYRTETVTSIFLIIAILSFLVNKIAFGIRFNQLASDKYISDGGKGFEMISTLLKLINSILIFIPAIRQVSFIYYLANSKVKKDYWV